MKKAILLLLVSLSMFYVASLQAQTIQKFNVVDNAFQQNADVYQGEIDLNILGSEQKAPLQISTAISKLQIDELHIYANTKPGAIVFNNTSITLETIDFFANDFAMWKQNVHKRVVIHSENVFDSEDGIKLKAKLESITGLEFIEQK